MPKYLRLAFCRLGRDVMMSFCHHGKGGKKVDDHRFCLEWQILCGELDGQVFSVVDVCSQITSLCSTVERLEFGYGDWVWPTSSPVGRELDDVDPTVCLDLFHSFTSTKTLEISSELEPFIAAALKEVPDGLVAEVLPALEKILICQVRESSWGLKSFVAAREHAGRPVVVTNYED